MSTIEMRGVRTHNLKNIDCSLPRDQLIVITGPSGSGKSSLAFDTLYAEGQRRYVESLSAYARQFLSIMEKPELDHIEGLSPAISIEQKSTSHNPRSTVGTITEIYDYLRLLFARVGQPRCPKHNTALDAQTVSQIVDLLYQLPDESKIMVLAPIVQHRKGEHLQLIQDLKQQGFIRLRINSIIYTMEELPTLDKQKKHNMELVVDRLTLRAEQKSRLAESIETALNLADDNVIILNTEDNSETSYSAKFACPQCGYSISELEPRIFSFNNPKGACQACNGLGMKQFFSEKKLINPESSLAGGAIRGWDKRHPYYFHLIKSLVNHYDIDINTPYQALPEKFKQIILYGSGSEKIQFTYKLPGRRGRIRTHAFEGLINNLERRYADTDSEAIQSDLAKYFASQPCPDCSGSRLNNTARHVFIKNKSLPDLIQLSITQAFDFFSNLKLTGKRGDIASKILQEICQRLEFLINVGLNYLSLARSAETLSGGEAQRIRLASQIGAGLVGVMYILDEPTIGLHQRDNQRLLKTLVNLRDLGNTVIVVEHDEDTIRAADHILDMGPGAGIKGGNIVAQGTLKTIMTSKDSLTGKYLSRKESIAIPDTRQPMDPSQQLTIQKASGNNLKQLTVSFPIGLMTCVTGVSGSGKSTLVNDTLFPLVAEAFLGPHDSRKPAANEGLDGVDALDKIVDIDQSPIGRTPRSNPATYTGIFTHVRELFANTQEARARGYQAGRFSFNVKGGRCEACQGGGLTKVEMHFLPDIYVQCDVCRGHRYNRETLEVKYKNKSILEVLNFTVEQACEFFAVIPSIANKCQTLKDVGLGYITLGQSAITLSGGEAQRVKLAKELSKRDTGRTLYILDEPTTGLHFYDVAQLLKVLQRLRDRGNTVVIIEHNLDVIKTADWIIDLGPEGGDQGGTILAQGTPEEITKIKSSYTGQFLKSLLTKNKKK